MGVRSMATDVGRRDREEKIKPAVDELADAQDELFDELERGLADRRELVLWIHKASARTLGRVPDEWPVTILSSRYRAGALLVDESEVNRSLSNLERRLIRDDTLMDACGRSMRFMSQTAAQYDGGGGDSEDGRRSREFGNQRWLAMRPALHELVQRQRTVLERALGLDPKYPDGLESHDDLARWVRTVIQASRGIDGGLSHDAIWSDWWRQVLLDDPTAVDLHLSLAEDVLTVFNAAIREEATAANESADEERMQRRAFNT